MDLSPHQPKTFSSPVKIGARAVAFIESEVEEWIQLTIDNSRNNVA